MTDETLKRLKDIELKTKLLGGTMRISDTGELELLEITEDTAEIPEGIEILNRNCIDVINSSLDRLVFCDSILEADGCIIKSPAAMISTVSIKSSQIKAVSKSCIDCTENIEIRDTVSMYSLMKLIDITFSSTKIILLNGIKETRKEIEGILADIMFNGTGYIPFGGTVHYGVLNSRLEIAPDIDSISENKDGESVMYITTTVKAERQYRVSTLLTRTKGIESEGAGIGELIKAAEEKSTALTEMYADEFNALEEDKKYTQYLYSVRFISRLDGVHPVRYTYDVWELYGGIRSAFLTLYEADIKYINNGGIPECGMRCMMSEEDLKKSRAWDESILEHAAEFKTASESSLYGRIKRGSRKFRKIHDSRQ